MRIVLSSNLGVVVVPIVPPGIPIPPLKSKNETFEAIQGDITLMGLLEPRTIGWSSFLPSRRYSYAATGSSINPQKFIRFIEQHSVKRQPFRITITRKGETLLNMLVTAEEFVPSYDKVGDVKYSISLNEYGQAKVKKV